MPKGLIYIIYAAAAFLLIVAAFKYVLPILVPFIIAFLLTVAIEPLIRVLQKKARFPRGFAAMTAMVVVFGGILVIVSAIVLKLVSELVQISLTLPSVASDLRIYYQEFIERFTAFYINLPPGVISSLEQNINNLTSSLQGLIGSSVNSLLMIISLVPSTITILIVSLIATYFLAKDRHIISETLFSLIPAQWREKSYTVVKEISAAFTGYLRAQFVLVMITTLLSIFGLYLVGAKYALTIGLLIGLTDLIPVIGPATIYLPWIIWSFVSGTYGFALKLTVLYVVVLITRQFLETKIVSSSMGLHPLATLVAMYGGLKLFGIPGLVLGPIILIAVQSVIKAGFLIPKNK